MVARRVGFMPTIPMYPSRHETGKAGNLHAGISLRLDSICRFGGHEAHTTDLPLQSTKKYSKSDEHSRLAICIEVGVPTLEWHTSNPPSFRAPP
jgi:hypothetical protein